jgi:prepilin peptidase CpaA
VNFAALPPYFYALLATLVLLAAAHDLRSRRIPNWLNASGVAAGFVINVLFFHAHGARTSFEGLLLASAVYFPLYVLRGMGAGDVKLMAAVGAIVGPSHWIIILIATALAGGVAGCVYAAAKGRFTDTCCNLYFLLKDLLHLRAPHKTNPQLDFRNPDSLRMPHGVIIAAASMLVVSTSLVKPLFLQALLSI